MRQPLTAEVEPRATAIYRLLTNVNSCWPATADEQHRRTLTSPADTGICARSNAYYSQSMFSRPPFRGSYYQIDRYFFAAFIDLTDPRTGRAVPSHFAMFDAGLTLLTVFPPSTPPASAATSAADSMQAVRQFVQSSPIALAGLGYPPWYHVLARSNQYLDEDLAVALRCDSVVQATGPTSWTREVLNFDPILDSQAPCGPYEVMDLARSGDTFRVPVRPYHTQGPGPVIEVRAVNDAWRIVNVRYDSVDLKSLLCHFAQGDSRPEMRPAKC